MYIRRGRRYPRFSRVVSLLAVLTLLGGVCLTGHGAAEEYPRYFHSVFSSVSEVKTAAEATAREVEAEGIVLLKNSGALPLKPGASVALLGVTAMDPVYGGVGSASIGTGAAPDFRDALTASGFEITTGVLLDAYVSQEAGRRADRIGEVNWDRLTFEGHGEDAVFVVGRTCGEDNDATFPITDAENGDYLRLNADEMSVLDGLIAQKKAGMIRSVMVVINSANPIALDFAENADVDAVLWIGTVGHVGLYALGDVLNGTINPSGSLPDTWWMDNRLDPVQNNFGPMVYEGADDFRYPSVARSFNRYVVYQEGIYVGYRYAETRYADCVMGTPNTGDFRYEDTVARPFGFGLSYTTFAYSDLRVEKTGNGTRTEYQVTVDMTNTGSVSGKKAVQVYAQKPYTDYDRKWQIEKSAVDLVGFGKTSLLAPGATETVTIAVPEYFLTSYDAANTEVFILDEGTYALTVADNAHTAVNNILAASGYGVDGDPAMVFTADYAFDDETYASAYGTGVEVCSLFSCADMNRYDGCGSNEVTYYSRSDWAGTVTDGPVQLRMTSTMYADLLLTEDDLPDEDEADWPVMGADAGIRLIDMQGVPYEDERWETFLDQLTFEDMARLCVNGFRMTYPIAGIGKPMTIDHNGPTGVTQRYDYGENGYAHQLNDPDGQMIGTCYPCNGIAAATMNAQLMQHMGEMIGEEAMWAGYAGLYGSGLNIHRSPYEGRMFEYYAEDGVLTGLIDTAETLGIQSKGVYVYNKHLVLNEQEENRAGLGTWCNEQALREIYLRAFELPIIYADAKCVMSSYNRLGAVWSSACTELMTDWLRGEVGMDGFAITDMFDTTYMVKANAIAAGCDIPDSYAGDDISELIDFAPDGEWENPAMVQAMRRSCHRVLYTVVNSRGMDGIAR